MMMNETDETEIRADAPDGIQQEHAGESERPASPGRMLKSLRQELGYSREKVAESLYITVHYVKALENDEYDKLPGLTFVKGYFKSYADFLKADVKEVLDCYEEYVATYWKKRDQSVRQVHNIEKKEKHAWLLTGAAIVVVIIIVFGLGWWVAGGSMAAHTSDAEHGEIVT